MSVIDDWLVHNTSHSAAFSEAELPAAPRGKVAVVTCMDARIVPSAILGLGAGDAHVIRNAGGVVTDDVVRSLAISQAALGTREIMVVQHTRCGLLAPSEEELRNRIRTATGSPPDFELLTFPDLEVSIRRSVARLRKSPQLTHKEHIRGFIYAVETGSLREIPDRSGG